MVPFQYIIIWPFELIVNFGWKDIELQQAEMAQLQHGQLVVGNTIIVLWYSVFASPVSTVVMHNIITLHNLKAMWPRPTNQPTNPPTHQPTINVFGNAS